MTLDKRNLYRLPWSMNDNPIAWLEVTDICNIHCEGCYRQHMTGHKTLEQLKEEVLFFKRWRNPDNRSSPGRPLDEKVIYCGNVISTKVLKDLTPRELSVLQKLNPTKRFMIEPGESSTFVIVFMEPPRGAVEYAVQVVGAQHQA